MKEASTYRNILMLYPEFPPTYWGMQYFLPLVGRKACSASTILTGALTHDFGYPSHAVASRILLPAERSGGGESWRGHSAWRRDGS